MFFCLVTFVEKPQLKKIGFQNYKYWYLIHAWSLGTIVNQTSSSLHEGPLETILIVPLNVL